jgi:hypothetical protein
MRAVARMLVAGAMVLSAGCASTDWIDRTLVTVDVTGTWQGSTDNAWVELVLEQQGGPRVKGSWQVKGAKNMGNTFSGPIDGDVTGDFFRFRDSRGQLEGALTVSGGEMDGRVSFLGSSRPIILRLVDSPSPPGSPPR